MLLPSFSMDKAISRTANFPGRIGCDRAKTPVSVDRPDQSHLSKKSSTLLRMSAVSKWPVS